ncbi:MAG: cbb3-type cytochrome oxidase assembly protein CcoS [Bdellovibrionales bacterium]|nr:cbb3-type cytochrome oxidase assembly protein CcoS [Bdellovibrionales bacterium]
MNILYMMVPMALLMGFIFIYLFIRVVRSGQYDDLDTPAIRILLDEEKKK